MPKSKRELGWDNDKERQRLWIHVGSWDYKVFFESPAWHRSYFFFEGAVSKGSYESSLIGLKVAGEIEIHLEALLPDEEEPPPDDLGSFNIVNEGPNPFLGVDQLGLHLDIGIVCTAYNREQLKSFTFGQGRSPSRRARSCAGRELTNYRLKWTTTDMTMCPRI